ncbi:hypothetical protein RFI_04736 [Reticulomyxa filosa]|uniref:Uncharacterized protein n=1 Tax=Reticulomyxa filosa TaxID=46433 RepID=X6P479_RETFI|nr:hypothetical protein RFI_04736 [Reticulomyxa filosa]|eukprot:ETO32382.1 hypothetical protein RFI_04736 [Reticulomyxa filosa]
MIRKHTRQKKVNVRPRNEFFVVFEERYKNMTQHREHDTLSETLEVAKELRLHNEELQNSLTELRSQYLSLEERLQQTVKDRHEAIQKKEQTEKECKSLYEKWNKQLTAQAKEFELIHSQMIPSSEIQKLKVELLSELEKPYRDKIDYLTGQCNEYFNKYCQTWKTLECLKSEHDNRMELKNQTISQLEQDHCFKIEELTNTIAKLETSEEKHKCKENISQLTEQNTDLTVMCQHLKEELNAIQFLSSIRTHIYNTPFYYFFLFFRGKQMLQTERIQLANVEALKTMEGKYLVCKKECEGYKIKVEDLVKDLEFHKEAHLAIESSYRKCEQEKMQLLHSLKRKDIQVKKKNEKRTATYPTNTKFFCNLFICKIHRQLEQKLAEKEQELHKVNEKVLLQFKQQITDLEKFSLKEEKKENLLQKIFCKKHIKPMFDK